MFISKKIELLRRAIWSWKQPLVCKPTFSSSLVSDLFIWRSSPEWETFFELIDIPSLFEDQNRLGYVTVIFFNKNGIQVLKKKIWLFPNRRRILNVSFLIGREYGEIGTFAIFHSTTPKVVSNLGSFLAERGYVNYCYRNAPLKAYVHGNLDAVAMIEDGTLQLIGGRSFLPRLYNLQYHLRPEVYYEFGLVNSSPKYQRFTCKFLSIHTGSILDSHILDIAPGGVGIATILTEKEESMRLIIKSRLVMARPLIFRIQNHKLDIFHG
jgi:hypothetical protein